jgi:hypothetical protein
MKNALLSTLLLFFSCTLYSQQTWYVNLLASGNNTGTSWSHAFTDLQDAMQMAEAGDAIFISTGTYFPTNGIDRELYFELKNGVHLYGGFNGAGQDTSDRNPELYPTILSGDIGIPGDSTDNSFTVLYGLNLDNNTRLDGIIIEEGNADLIAGTEPYNSLRNTGAGMFLEGNNAYVRPVFFNCTFRNNRARTGAGVACMSFTSNTAFNPRFDHCLFSNNYATGDGGGLLIFDHNLNDSLYIQSCTFSGNLGVNGSAIYLKQTGNNTTLSGKVIYILNSKFTNNASYLQTSGSLISFDTENNLQPGLLNELLIIDCKIEGNTSGNKSIISTSYSRQILNNNEIIENTGNSIFSTKSEQVNSISNSQFTNNEAQNLMWLRGNSIVSNCYFTSNSGASLLNVGASSDFNSINQFIQNKVINNEVNQYISVYLTSFESKLDIIQNVFVKNSGQFLNLHPGGNFITQFQHNSFINCRPADSLLIRVSNGGQTNFNSCLFALSDTLHPYILNNQSNLSFANCLFTQPDSTFLMAEDIFSFPGQTTFSSTNLWGTQPEFIDSLNGDFRLSPCSPGINAGDDAPLLANNINSDFNGQARIENGQSDIGALETVLFIESDSLSSVSCPGEADGSISFQGNFCPPLELTWTHESGQTGDALSNLAPGTYFLTISDTYNNINWLDTVLIEEPAPITYSFAVEDASGPNTPDGSISILNPVGGTPPLLPFWSNSVQDWEINQVPPGEYLLLIYDANKCIQIDTFLVDFTLSTQFNAPKEGLNIFPNPASSQTPITIQTEHPVSIDAFDSGGRCVFSKKDLTASQSVRIPALPVGTYLIRVVDQNKGVLVGKLVVTD